MIQQMSVQELEQRLKQGRGKPLVLDVREPWELNICSFPEARHIPMGSIPSQIENLEKDDEIVILCHHGVRSYQVAYFLQHHGFTKLYNLQGGIDAWAKQIDPHMQKY